jgi:hypothetical protein
MFIDEAKSVAKSDRPEERIGESMPFDSHLDRTDLLYRRDTIPHNSFNNVNPLGTNNPDESCSYMNMHFPG